MIGGVEPAVLRVLGGIFVALAAGSALRYLSLHGASEEEARPLLDSLKVWWIVAVAVALATVTGRVGATVLVGGVSVACLDEYLRLADEGSGLRALLPDALLVVAAGLLLLAAGRGRPFVVLFPPAALLWISARLVVRDRAEGFLRTGGAWLLGVLLLGYAPGHAALVVADPPADNPVGGPAGWFLLLVSLDQANDIVQALVGRRVGRRPVAPVLSPRKTVEGLLGGIVGTVGLALVLAPLLTPLGGWEAALVGLAIALSGYLGDLTVSGVKRDVGVKDSGTLLPGHGGMLDRADSLLLSAPVFYYLIAVLA